MHLRLLGGFVLTPHAALPMRVQSLLALLATRAPQLLGRSEAAALLMPDLDTDRARTYLRQALQVLRKAAPALAAGITGPDEATLRFDAGVIGCDVHTFRAAYACADWAGAVAHYGGDLLPLATEECLLHERAALRESWLDALAKRAGQLQEACDWPASELVLGTLLRADPFNEPAVIQLMRARAMRGNRAGVSLALREQAELLKRELNLAPGPALLRAHARLLRVDAARLDTLPSRDDALIGRASQVAAINGWLREGARLISVTGPGGMGKTRLVIEAARACVGRYAHGVMWVPLEGCASPDRFWDELTRALGHTLRPGETAEDAVLALLADSEMLLVLDNLEHLLAAGPALPGMLAKLLKSAPDCAVLASSRQACGLRNERVLLLGGLDAPDCAALFEAVAQRAGFELRQTDRDMAGRLHSLTGGLPLAIELAGAVWQGRSIAALLDTLLANIDTLSHQAPDMPARQHSVRATFEHVLGQLDSRARAAFVRLCALQTPWELPAARALLDRDDIPEVATLTGKCLVHATGEGATYAIHPLLREHGLSLLRNDARLHTACLARLARYWAGRIHAEENDLRSARSEAVINGWLNALPDIETAWDAALAQNDLEALQRFPTVMRVFARRNMNARTLEMFDRRAADMRARATDPRIAGAYCRMLLLAAPVHHMLGALPAAIALAQEGKQYAALSRSDDWLGMSARVLATLCCFDDQLDAAAHEAEVALRHFEQWRNNRLVNDALIVMGRVAAARGQLDCAAGLLLRAVNALTLEEDPDGAPVARFVLAEVWLRQGRLDDAEALTAPVITDPARFIPQSVARTQALRAHLLHLRGEPAAARSAAADAAMRALACHTRDSAGQVLWHLAPVAERCEPGMQAWLLQCLATDDAPGRLQNRLAREALSTLAHPPRERSRAICDVLTALREVQSLLEA